MPVQPDDPINYEMKIPPEPTPKRGRDSEPNAEPGISRENEEPSQRDSQDHLQPSGERDRSSGLGAGDSLPEPGDTTE